MKLTETQIQSSIIDYLEILESQGKLWFSRLNNIPPVNKGANGKMTFRKLPKGCKKGIPDILVIKGMRTIAIEVKTAIGKQSKEQKEVEEHFKRQGQEYYLIRSLIQAMEILK
ncbi:MAG: VRR-NUC domain-containing protein [Fusobacteriaceae bacterium]